MCAAVFEGREDDTHAVGPSGLLFILKHFAHVVGVAQADIAFACPDRLNLCAVIAFWRSRKVFADAVCPIFRAIFANMVNYRGEQGEVVVVQAGACTDAVGPFFGCKIFIGRDFAICDAIFGGIDDACACRQSEPEVFRAAECFRNSASENFAVDRLKNVRVNHALKICDVDGHDQIGWGACALRLEAFDETVINELKVHADACVGCERVHNGLDQIRLARGVDCHISKSWRCRRKKSCRK